MLKRNSIFKSYKWTFLVIMFSFLMLFGFSVVSTEEASADTSTYTYTISYDETGEYPWVLTGGGYTNLQCDSFDTLIDNIDSSRLVNGEYQDCTITIDNQYFPEELLFENGNYTITSPSSGGGVLHLA